MKRNPNRACLKRSTKPAPRQGKQTLRLHLRTRSLPDGGGCYQLADARTGRVFLSLVMKPELPSLLKVAERQGVSLIASMMDALIRQLPKREPEIKGQGRAAA